MTDIPKAASRQQAAETRRRLMAEDYFSGMSLRNIGEKYGLKRDSVKRYFSMWGIRLTDEERLSRAIAGAKMDRVWPRCPDHLREQYDEISRYYTRAEARKMLEDRL